MKKRSTLIIGLFFGAILMSCGNAKELEDATKIAGFDLGDTTSMKLKDIVLCNDDISLFVTFDSLMNDSRCPIGDNCIWEGNAEVGFSVTYKKQLEYISLNTSQKMGKTSNVYGFKFELIELNPYPGSKDAGQTPTSVKIVVTKA